MSITRRLSLGLREYVDASSISRPRLGALAALQPGSLRPRRVHSGDAVASAAVRRARVSVIIPCYNYGRFLPGAVRSAVAQIEVDVDVIIVDDASTDDSAQVAATLAAADPRVRLVRSPRNIGHVRAFNLGLESADGEFIARLDADDELANGALGRAVALFDAEPTVGLVYGHPRHFMSEDAPASQVGAVTWTTWDGVRWLAERCRRGSNCITTPEAVVRSSVIDKVGPLDTRLRYAQDMEMWCRVASVSDVARVNGADQALHRDHPGSMSATDGSGALLDLRERTLVFDAVFEGAGADLSQAKLLHRVARRTLASEAVDRAHRLLDRPAADPAEVAALVDYARATAPEVFDSGRGRSLIGRLDKHGARSRPVLGSVLLGHWNSIVREVEYIRWTYRGI